MGPGCQKDNSTGLLKSGLSFANVPHGRKKEYLHPLDQIVLKMALVLNCKAMKVNFNIVELWNLIWSCKKFVVLLKFS